MIRHPNPIVPRASGLTALVTADAPVPERLDPSARRRLAVELAARVPVRSQGPQRFDSWRLTTLAEDHPPTPFVWRPRIARRVLGLGGAMRVHCGDAPSPLAGVRAEVAAILEQASRRGTGRGSLATWLSEIPRGSGARSWPSRPPMPLMSSTPSTGMCSERLPSSVGLIRCGRCRERPGPPSGRGVTSRSPSTLLPEPERCCAFVLGPSDPMPSTTSASWRSLTH